MPELSIDKLRDQLKRREILPVYVLYGEETYLRDLAAKTITERSFSDGDFRDFNESTFSLNSSDIKGVISSAEQLPMMSEKRVVKVTEVVVSTTAARDLLKEASEELLAKYLDDPSDSTVLIFVADELNGTRKISKLLKDKAAFVEFKRMDEAAFEKWTAAKIKESGSEIDGRALKHLTATVGLDARRMYNEVEKLSTAALPDRLITIELIDSLVVNSREIDSWQITNNIVAGNKKNALLALKKLMDDGGEPLMLLGTIAGNFRKLARAKDQMRKGLNNDAVARPFTWKYREQSLAYARRTGNEKFTLIFDLLAKTDVAIKTSIGGGGNKGSQLQIEKLLAELVEI